MVLEFQFIIYFDIYYYYDIIHHKKILFLLYPNDKDNDYIFY